MPDVELLPTTHDRAWHETPKALIKIAVPWSATMDVDKFTAAIAASYLEAHATIAKTENQTEREAAMLSCYGRNAEISAGSFVDDVVENECPEYRDDLKALGERHLEKIIEIFVRENARLGLMSPEFFDATKRVAGDKFFGRVDELLSFAAQPPLGSA